MGMFMCDTKMQHKNVAQKCVGCSVGKAHLVEDVIYNLSKDPMHYKDAPLTYYLGVKMDLYKKYTNK